eukprot:CAMPEP_0204898904 /NCGR_PEP_ID=MMETSP1397-20131031/1548_1 /ASSEMBLY_ACC=CAM_ASM_000891 /TAXON_ID=49980 /ORGANISM="Climacostomum Climacostomum virens, Strain Stock W-24" /LENGTH=165 /DNA_ID=CAMNT_0052066795 /DNA_START=123 /DNA_END=617 /DNA_ORIENTATION=+
MTHEITLGTQDILAISSVLADAVFVYLISPSSIIFKSSFFEAVELMFNFREGRYFSLLEIAYAIEGVAIMLTLLCALNRFSQFKFDVQLCAFLILRLAFPVQAYILMSTFDCSEAASETDPDLDESFMDVDCHSSCWAGKHLKFALASALSLSAYNFISIPTSSH